MPEDFSLSRTFRWQTGTCDKCAAALRITKSNGKAQWALPGTLEALHVCLCIHMLMHTYAYANKHTDISWGLSNRTMVMCLPTWILSFTPQGSSSLPGMTTGCRTRSQPWMQNDVPPPQCAIINLWRRPQRSEWAPLWWYSGLTAHSALRSHCWQCLGEANGVPGVDPDQMHARQVPYLLFYHSSLGSSHPIKKKKPNSPET